MPTFDVTKAVNWIMQHGTRAKSGGKCASYVRQAINAGGLKNIAGNNGVNFWKSCKDAGFTLVNSKVRINGRVISGCQPGDVCCSRSETEGKRGPDNKTYGHVCMYTPKGWYSDYIQHDKAIPYRTGIIMSGTDRPTVWRYSGEITLSGSFNDIIPGSENVDSSGNVFAQNEQLAELISQGNALLALQNAYPVHQEYRSFDSKHGNIFAENNNAMDLAMFSNSSVFQDTSLINSNKKGRIYSTNDALIVLDELSLPNTYKDDEYVSKGATEQERKTMQSTYDKINLLKK